MRRPRFLNRLVEATSRRFLSRLHRITHRTPMQERTLAPARILVIAPHSDDEVIGAGGVLALHQDLKSTVRVLYVTSDANAPMESEAARRIQEARQVAEYLAFEPVFLECTDGAVSREETKLKAAIESHLSEFRPDCVLAPFPGDHHRDHQATTAATAAALRSSGFDGEVWCYEIWSALWPNVGINIDRVIDRKRHAIDLYKSQTHTMPYADAALSLNRYRGMRIYAPHAEAFYVCSPSVFDELTAGLSTP